MASSNNHSIIIAVALLVVITVYSFSADAFRVRRVDERTAPATAPWEAPGPSRMPSTTPTEFIEEALKVHNVLRKLHGVPELVINQTLNEISQSHATKQLALGADDFDNNPDSETYTYGENLYWIKSKTAGKKPTATNVVNKWYKEIANYNFETGTSIDDDKEYLHFTQIVWKSTTQLGISYASTEAPDSEGYYFTYIVADYYPKAYEDGTFKDNVFPLVGNNGEDIKKREDKSGDTATDKSDGKAEDTDSNSTTKGKSSSLQSKFSLAIGCVTFSIYFIRSQF